MVPDVIPELAEKFSMKLKSVELIDSEYIKNPNFVPLLGNITMATVMIAANQDPHGLLSLHVQDDNGTLQREVVVMATKPGRSVQLRVQRLGKKLIIHCVQKKTPTFFYIWQSNVCRSIQNFSKWGRGTVDYASVKIKYHLQPIN